MHGFEFETVYRPAWNEAAVGGDFYDVFAIGEDKIGIAVGDVSGKGLAAAAQVAMVKYFLRSSAYECESPALVSDHVNKALVSDSSAEGFATVFFGVLDCASKTLTYANGGHSPAILWRREENDISLLAATGTVLGYDSATVYTEKTICLNPGDEVFLGTDGLYEVQCGGTYLEIEGLVELYVQLKRCGRGSGAEIVGRVAELCNERLRDDVAVLRICLPDSCSEMCDA
jgi:sigma-B regulation protein RsbU (phosphoserine phosphatase)